MLILSAKNAIVPKIIKAATAIISNTCFVFITRILLFNDNKYIKIIEKR